jgi:hypothetical protein
MVLRRADLQSKKSYQLSIRFIISELVLEGNRPQSPIRQGKRRRRIYMRIVYYFLSKGNGLHDGYWAKMAEDGINGALTRAGNES